MAELTDLERVTTNGAVEVLAPHNGRKFVLALDCSGATNTDPVKRVCLGLLQAIERQAGYQEVTILMFDIKIRNCFVSDTRADPERWIFSGGAGGDWDCVAEILNLQRPAINPKLTSRWWLNRDDQLSVITVTDGMVHSKVQLPKNVRSSVYLTWDFGKLLIPGERVMFDDERWFLRGSGPSVHNWAN